MTRIIAVASGKGGVGKTTVVSNLSAALAGFNRSVIAVEGNTTTPNLGLHLGIPLYPKTIQDVMRGKAGIREAMHYHSDGFRVIPGDMSVDKVISPQPHRMVDAVYKLLGESEFILIDTAAGLGDEAASAIKAADELLVVVNPDLASLTEALKLIKLAEKQETRAIGAVVNRIRNEGVELGQDEIEGFLGIPVIGKISEDYAVRRAASEGSPVVTHSPGSLAAQQFMAMAASLTGEGYIIRMPLIHKLFGWLRF
jgi:septum site-determining protein MinD